MISDQDGQSRGNTGPPQQCLIGDLGVADAQYRQLVALMHEGRRGRVAIETGQ